MRYIIFISIFFVSIINIQSSYAKPKSEFCVGQKPSVTKAIRFGQQKKPAIENMFGVKLRGTLRGVHTFSYKRCKKN
ncbi:hypothetical protein NA8A_01835 [Nitratireductor indicus C115]|uniref:Uncharacterized protein n=1 Tax=Nitratireductor indicus C115 TaxID=1231190 RepID=K2N9Z2_9HYPH|nr:hypothetical protein NA8A_01835 [Nitratireductor indicus C115]SFQ29554.1 hypothetical protein SAMN05216176_102372 [Nitratireductor indicus]